MAREIVVSRAEMIHFNEMREVFDKFLKDDAQGLKGICQKNPEALYKPITAGKDTIFHIAAYNGRVKVLRALVEVAPQSKKRELLKMKNIHGNTILHEVAASSKTEAAAILVTELLYSEVQMNRENDNREQQEILADRNKLGETPLFRAAGWGNMHMVKYLAGEIERIGNIQSHCTRDDQLSILHIAVIGQRFDTAIWFLGKDPKLATCKDNNGKTCLHLLASMPNAFRSTSAPAGKFCNCIYNCLPSSLLDGDDKDQLPLNLQNKDLEQGESSKGPDQSEGSKGNSMVINLEFPGFRLYCSMWGFLKAKFKIINRIWQKKARHESAVKLARKLVETDGSRFKPPEVEESGTICLERKVEEERVMNTAASEESPEPETPLFIAASTGIVEIVEDILTRYPQAVQHINKKGQNILHVAILHRKFDVFDLVKKKYVVKKNEVKKLVRRIHNNGNTIMHHAADIEYYHGTEPTPPLQMRKAFTRFEDVKNCLPSQFTLHRNKKNRTADELFEDMHGKQLKTAQEWVKKTCQSCSAVAVLVAAGVFAAAYSAPGGFDKGQPVLQEKEKLLYSFFTVMDVAGLASSLTSVVIFLSILISSLEFQDFHRTIPLKIATGFIFLFFSLFTTMLTFTATILLLFQTSWKTRSLAYVATYAATLFPICVFTLFQFPLYYSYCVAAVNIIVDLLNKYLPGN